MAAARAGEVFDARLKVGGRRLPAGVVVPLAFMENLLLGVFGGSDRVAPAYVLVTRLADGMPVGRIHVGSGYSGQLDLLEAVQRSIEELDEDDFVARWELGLGP